MFDDLRWKQSLDGQISIKFSIFPWFPWGVRWFSTGFRIGFSDRHQIHRSSWRFAKEKVLEMLNCRVVGRTEENLRTSKALGFCMDLRISRKMGMVHTWKNSDYIINDMYINNDSSSNSNSNNENKKK